MADMRELNERIAKMAGCTPDLIEVPDFVAAGIAMAGAQIGRAHV